MQEILFPAIKPYDTGFLQVSELHQIFYAQYGNPTGIPIIWLHGGPGGGCSDNDTGYLDSNYYRIILLDQRGAGKSKPFCEMVENNTQNLISDLEKLRIHLNVEKWVVLGNSWGTLLALCYAIAYPQNILGLILRSIFTGTRSEDRKSTRLNSSH